MTRNAMRRRSAATRAPARVPATGTSLRGTGPNVSSTAGSGSAMNFTAAIRAARWRRFAAGQGAARETVV